MSETWEASADLNMQDYWRDAIGGSWTPVKYSKHVSWHPTTIKAEIDAHRTEPIADCLVGLVFRLAMVSNREDVAWSAVKAKDAEIASLRAQLDEARARVKTFEMAIAQLPEMPAIMDERAARRRAIEDAANVVARSVFPLPTDAEIARDGGGIAVMRAAAMARDAIEQQIRALLSESKT